MNVLRAKVADGVAISFAPMTHRTMVLVTVTSSDGISGHGESWVNFPSWAYNERISTLIDGIAPIIRENPRGTPLSSIICW